MLSLVLEPVDIDSELLRVEEEDDGEVFALELVMEGLARSGGAAVSEFNKAAVEAAWLARRRATAWYWRLAWLLLMLLQWLML